MEEEFTDLSQINEVPAPVEEIPLEWQWERLRLRRDSLLKKSDYRIVADAPWDIQPWIEYRQALRELPKKNKDPKKIVFPDQPA
jgi:hypothetical protein